MARSIGTWNYDEDDRASLVPSLAGRGNRRRALVFLGTLAVALAVSLAFTFLRPAEYRASARVEIAFAPPPATAEARPPPAAPPLAREVQVLTSRPVLQAAAGTLERQGFDLSDFGADPVTAMQSRLQATALPNSTVVEVAATGPQPGILAALINTTIEAYRARLAESFDTSSTEELAAADAEVTRLDTTVKAKRREVERFKETNNIVSLERDENQVLARVRSQNAALNAASERVTKAENKLRDVAGAVAAGNNVIREQDTATVASLQQRLAQTRDELAELDRRYTADYLSRDPDVKVKRGRLADMQNQLETQLAQTKQAALADAKEELASAKAGRQRLEGEILADRSNVAQFTRRFDELKARDKELGQLELAYRDAVQRKATLEASERARAPAVRVLEAATIPERPWRPDYWRDAGISAAASLVLALLVMLLVELFNRSDPQPTVLVAQRVGIPRPAIGLAPPPDAAGALAAGNPALLTAPVALPRQLDDDEVRLLLDAAGGRTRILITLLLSGLTPEEVMALRRSDLDLGSDTVRLGGASPRELKLPHPVAVALAAVADTPSERLIEPHANVDERATMDAELLCAAHDAALDVPAEVTASALRHTYIVFLVRQGIRFADLSRIIGPLPVDVLAAYSSMAGSGSRRSIDAVDLVHPAIRQA